MTQQDESPPAKRAPIGTAEWIKIAITAAVLVLTYAALNASGYTMGRRETLWFVVFTALPFLALAAILYFIFRTRQSHRKP
jgi:hypothetical protein